MLLASLFNYICIIIMEFSSMMDWVMVVVRDLISNFFPLFLVAALFVPASAVALQLIC